MATAGSAPRICTANPLLGSNQMTTFDALAAARTLEGAGMDPAQAAAVTETIRSAATEGVATRSDLANLRGDLAELRGELGAMEARLTWRMVLVAGAVTALVAGLDRLLA